MFAAHVFTALLALAAPLIARADVTPNEPAPNEIFNAGTTCHIAWDGDSVSTTAWKGMAIELMTGDNFNMVHLTTVTTNQDGSTSGTFDYPCPQVTPNSAIYFYQFSAPQAANKTWTGRFAIASSSGQTTPPSNPTQPENGAAIPWGTGALVDPSTAVAAPAFDNATTSGTASGNGTVSATAVASTSAPVVVPTATPTLSTITTTPAVATNIATTSSAANSTTTTTAASGALGAANAGSASVWLGAAALLAVAASW